MDTATLPAETEGEQGAPVEGAEATRSAANLFQYSKHVHVGVGAEECEHGEDGACKDAAHFHGWVCLPNSLQRRDILDKARAAKARRKRALRDAGSDARGPSDAYVTLESDLDDLMAQERPPLLRELAERTVGKGGVERVGNLIENEERFKNYWQDAEEHERLKALPEEERPQGEWESLDAEMTDFEETLERETEAETVTEVTALEALSEENLRREVRKVRVEASASETHVATYYVWMGFACTRIPSKTNTPFARSFTSLEEFRNVSPEVLEAIEEAVRDLEARHARGDAAGN